MTKGKVAIAHDFGVMSQYAAEHKVALTPKQQFVPVRHIREMMAGFQEKEPHEDIIGEKVYKKREELEYPRFYFLDLLALSGGFLRITRGGRFRKGSFWNKFFETPAKDRPFLLFFSFQWNFHFEGWFLGRGGGFGERLEERSGEVWSHVMKWKNGQVVDWRSWACEVIEDCNLQWVAPDQTLAKDHMIWGLEYCLIKPMHYLGVLDLKYKQGEYGQELHALQLNSVGMHHFKKLNAQLSGFRRSLSFFSAN